MATLANTPVPVAVPRARAAWLAGLPRALTILVTAAAVLAPLSLIVYQSLLSAPFFDAVKSVGLDAYAFVFADPDFWSALVNSLLIAAGMTVIAVPLGAILASVMARTCNAAAGMSNAAPNSKKAPLSSVAATSSRPRARA